MEDPGVGQIAQGDVEDPLDLVRAGHHWGRAGTVATSGMMSDADTTVMTGWIHPSRLTCAGVEGDLLVGLAQGRGRGVLPGVEAATGKADLAAVRAQRRGAAWSG